jgi:transposase-like protein
MSTQHQNSNCKTRKEIAAEYGIDPKTFYRWLKAAGIQLRPGRVTPEEQELIYRTFGKPKPPPNEKT